VTLGREDGVADLTALIAKLSELSGVDAGHFTHGDVRDHSSHLESTSRSPTRSSPASRKPRGTRPSCRGADRAGAQTIVCEPARSVPAAAAAADVVAAAAGASSSPALSDGAEKKKAAPSKRAKGRARMSKGSDLSRAEVSILGKMATLDADTPRYRALEAALASIVVDHPGRAPQRGAAHGLWKGWASRRSSAGARRDPRERAHGKKLVRSFQ